MLMVDTIKIICATCEIEVDTPRDETDPPNATVLRGIVCPDCDTGGFDMPEYYDKNGREVSGDPETFNAHSAEPKP